MLGKCCQAWTPLDMVGTSCKSQVSQQYYVLWTWPFSVYVSPKLQDHFFPLSLYEIRVWRLQREDAVSQYFIFYFVTPIAVEIYPQSCSLPPLHSTSKLGATAHPWPESQLVETSIISWHWQHSSDSDQPRAWPKKRKKPTKVVILSEEEMQANIASASSWLRNTSVSILRIDSGWFFPCLVMPAPEWIYQETEDKSQRSPRHNEAALCILWLCFTSITIYHSRRVPLESIRSC